MVKPKAKKSTKKFIARHLPDVIKRRKATKQRQKLFNKKKKHEFGDKGIEVLDKAKARREEEEEEEEVEENDDMDEEQLVPDAEIDENVVDEAPLSKNKKKTKQQKGKIGTNFIFNLFT